MNTPTYKQQFDKITEAYIKGEVAPLSACACFIGNLLNRNDRWAFGRVFEGELGAGWQCVAIRSYAAEICLEKESGNLYTIHDIVKMEQNFLVIWQNGGRTEESLFIAMESTLEMLRQIHESKGENTEYIPLQKRQLQFV